ncbi:hypothetical protein FRB96_009177 [Tulasnella sp. 330]|nr:hypothetical protein FRB96_009177 [Tulasnella sp. 330]KAG8880910.1 hypothetical protein FRB97_000354 [Tulasnella sp. 331]
MSSIASSLLPSLFEDHEAWLKEDIQKRTIVPLNNRRQQYRRPAILRKLGHLRLSLPSVRPPPPPPPEHIFTDMDVMDADLEQNPYSHWISRDGTGRWRRKTGAALNSQRVLMAMMITVLVVLAMVFSMIPQGTVIALIRRVQTS